MRVELTSLNTIRHNKQNVGTTAIALGENSGRRHVLAIYNNSNKTVYLGNSDVTINNGFPLLGKSFFEISSEANLVLYGLVENGIAEIRYMEGG